MTTLTTLRRASLVPTITNPCGEADLLEKLQAKSRRIMVVDGSADATSYSIVTQWEVAHQLVNAILSAYCECANLRRQQLTELEAEVISHIAIDERVDIVFIAGSSPNAITRLVGHNPAAIIRNRTQIPVLYYGA